MEADAPSSASEDNLSHRDRIIQRLAVNGVPDECFEDLPSGLVAYARDHLDQLSTLVATMLPTDAEVAVANSKVNAQSLRSPSTLPLKAQFRESMVLLQWLMFEGDPRRALDSIIMRIGQHGVCGAVWGKDDVAFRCRTCEHDSTCAICVSCFQNGNHKDHDYSIIYTSGGCCDCGDETAWKPEGFCSEHSGAGTLQPLPDDIARSVGPVLDCLFDCWKSKLLIAEGRSTSSNKSSHCAVADELTFAIVEMLLEFCKCSESLLNYISKRLIAVPCLMDILVRAERYMDEAVMKKLHELLLKLLSDPTFKFEFAKVLVNNYPVFLNDDLKSSTNNGTIARRFRCLSIFSVQIFTVPTLTLRLVKEINLLAVLIECLAHIFSSGSGEDGLLKLSKWGHMFDVTLPVIEDIKFVMSHPEVAQYVAREQQHVFRIWLRVISFVQGMNYQKRRTDIHVEEENDNIQLPFYLCYSIANINSLLVAGAFSEAIAKGTSQPSSSNLCIQNAGDFFYQRQAEVVQVSHESDTAVQLGENQCQDMLQGSVDEPAYVLLAVECLKFIDQWFQLGCTSSDSDSFSLKEALTKVGEQNYSPRLYGGPRSTTFQMWYWRGAESEMDLDEMDAESSCDLLVNDDNKMEEDLASELGPLQMLCMPDWQTINYDISSQDISVHIPLHGSLSLILKEALGKFYGERLVPCTPSMQDRSLSANQCFFGKYLRGCQPFGFSSLMMEHPLRIRVFCAQVRAGMWKRNGDNALLSSEYYHSALWSALILELDLFLLQICAALAPPDLYIRRILERFGLLNYLSLDKEPSSEYEPVLVKEMLTLIIQIVKERRYCGSTLSENLQRELVCKLATGDATRSQLQKWLPRDLAKLNQLQEVLDRVAHYSHPSGMKQGRYSLRLSFWKDLDLYHLRWNPRDLQDAEEKYLRVCGVSPLTTQLPNWTNICEPLIEISSIATCKMVLEIIRCVILYAVTDKSAQSRAPDGVLIAGLHLLALGLDICLAQRQSSHFSDHEEIIPILAFAGEEINTGSPNGSGQSSLLSLLVTLMRMHKDNSLGGFMEAGNFNLSPLVENLLKKYSQLDSGCKSKLLQLAPDIFSSLIQPSLKNDDFPGFTSTAEKRKAKAREMQNAIMAKMRAQQSKFMESVKTSEENELDASGKEDKVSHTRKDLFNIEHEVCSLCHGSSSTDSVSLLVLLQKSKLISYVDRGPPSWDPSEQSDKGKGLVVPQTAKESSPLESPDTATTKQEIPTPQLIQLVQSAASEFSQGALPEDINAFVDCFGAHFPAVRKMSVPHIADDRRDRTVSSLESLEHDMFSSIKKVMDVSAHDTVMVNNDEISTVKNTPVEGTEIDTILLGKYVAAIATEDAEISSASDDSGMRNESALKRYDGFGPAGCDGIHFSSCGHVVHKRCLDRYLSSLRDRYSRRLIFEGGHIVDPDQGEFLCPVCRRLANCVLPADHGDYWKLRKTPGSSDMNSLDHNGSLAAQNKKFAFRLQDALHLMESATAFISKGESIEVLPVVNRRMSPEHEPVSQDLVPLFKVLVRLYFPGGKDAFSNSGRVSPPLLVWDTLKYSLISTEIAARSACKTTASSSQNSLYSELLSGGGIRMALLVRIVESIKSSNSLDMLLRLRGIHQFAVSVCSGSSCNKSSTITKSREGKVLQILKYIDAGVPSPDIQFWSRASDPVLSRDPFSSLMWILFCLPRPCISDRDSLLCLVHIFYAVSIIQGVIGYFIKNGQPTIGPGIDRSLVTDFYKLVAESAVTHQYLRSNYINPTSNFEDTVRFLSLPFLRRCALLWRLLNVSGVLKSDASDGTGGSGFGEGEIYQLECMFQIPALDLILADKQLWNQGMAWFLHMRESSEHLSTQRPLHLTPAVPFQLMRLPLIYQDLLQRYIKAHCPVCQNVLPDPALCLLCGRLCSPSWKPCCRENGCEAHAKSCGAGTGVFLLMKNTSVLLQRNARRAVWASPYLDAFGEEDPDMHRGKPLYLNEERYAALNYMVASHGLDRNSRVLRQTTTGTFFMV